MADETISRAAAAPRLLVFSKTTGYRHASIETGVAAIRAIGAANGVAVDTTEDAGVFTPGDLAAFDAVMFLSTSGELFDDDQRAALEGYVRSGGGYVGVHAASTTEYDWPFYGELAGARFDGHPEIQPATVLVEDAGDPSTAHLPSPWTWTDEWYNFTEDPRPGVHVLLSVDESSYRGGTMGPGHPIAWRHTVGKGRCFYTALGHTEEAYADPLFRSHLLGGISETMRRRLWSEEAVVEAE